ncbi:MULTISPECIES: bifunctional hydroxymethylpyrimidine kinase/phosphomethylpyrimidine kinase [Pseudosulfitobacter]|uniref:bifunctional hydroxymethylpyrimidine kinase/phosphomethylpyrimidine kinase n=1 Tax=Pseudosulfitobacter pseudonitzschiae TaxID=1402135 RepID=UPI000932B435|nr:bifunctional hydroxymethylpyrimidine kinase/phosphomethylpyrimidine kinase [Pseudosulfitobacter pseudonitzschiae]
MVTKSPTLAVLDTGGRANGYIRTNYLVLANGMLAFSAAGVNTRNTYGKVSSFSSVIATYLTRRLAQANTVGHALGWWHQAALQTESRLLGQDGGPVRHIHTPA